MEGDVVQTSMPQTGVPYGCMTCPYVNRVALEQMAGLPVTVILLGPLETVTLTRAN